MADLSQVEETLVSTLSTALFPTIAYRFGDVQPSAAGPQVRLYRGWPTSSLLDSDLIQGTFGTNPIQAFVVNVSVIASPGMARNTTRHERMWYQPFAQTAPTLTAIASYPNVVTFIDVPAVGQVVGVATGFPATLAYAHRVTATDTLNTICAAFATAIPGATAVGNVLTISSCNGVFANVVQDTQVNLNLRRQDQHFKVTVWAPTPESRDFVASYVDNAMAQADAFQFADGSWSLPPVYRGTFSTDAGQVHREWRREFTYSIDYETTQVVMVPSMLFGNLNLPGLSVLSV